MSVGQTSEDLVEFLCHRMFLRDFVVRGPRFGARGRPREAADILVPFRDDLIAFQVRAAMDGPPQDEVAARRLERKVEAAIKQVKTVTRAIRSQSLRTVRNARGIEVPFDCTKTWKISGVVIVDLPAQASLPRDQRTLIYNGFEVSKGIPVHIFLRADFELVVSEIDTLPDFLRYLDARERLIGNRIVAPFTDERDFLALYKMNHEAIRKALAGELDFLVVAEGIWDDYKARHARQIELRDEANHPSYAIDHVIEEFHKVIGYDLKADDPDAALAEVGTIEGYQRVVTELASLHRLARRSVGELLIAKMHQADDTGHGYAVVIDEPSRTGYLVLATNRSRAERLNALANLCQAALVYQDLVKVVGIATEPASNKGRSFTGAVIEGPFDEESRLQLLELARGAFGAISRTSTSEFPRLEGDDSARKAPSTRSTVATAKRHRRKRRPRRGT